MMVTIPRIISRNPIKLQIINPTGTISPVGSDVSKDARNTRASLVINSDKAKPVAIPKFR